MSQRGYPSLLKCASSNEGEVLCGEERHMEGQEYSCGLLQFSESPLRVLSRGSRQAQVPKGVVARCVMLSEREIVLRICCIMCVFLEPRKSKK